jgi:hypothetical protein
MHTKDEASLNARRYDRPGRAVRGLEDGAARAPRACP